MLGSDSWSFRETEAYGIFLFTILSRGAFMYDRNGESVFLWKKYVDRSPPHNIEVKLCPSARLQHSLVQNFGNLIMKILPSCSNSSAHK
jgi:hypothetical protein